MNVSSSRAILKSNNLLVREGRLYWHAVCFKWTRMGADTAEVGEQPPVATADDMVLAQENQPELRELVRTALQKYNEMKSKEYTDTILNGVTTRYAFCLPIGQLINLAVRGYPSVERVDMQGARKQRRIRNHQPRNMVASHIGPCMGKKKLCAHPGHNCWRTHRKDVSEKNRWASKKSQPNSLARPTFPNSTTLRGTEREERSAKRRRQADAEEESARRKKAQREIDITDDGFFQNAFGLVDNEAVEAGQGGGGAPREPRAFKQRDRQTEAKKRGYAGCALYDVV